MTLQDVLKQLENTAEREYNISNHFLKLSKGEEPDSFELLSERMAFDFQPDYNHEQTGWGTYYGPHSVFPNDDGTLRVWPHYSLISEETLKYWSNRANESINPILSGRYADLVWDFSYKIIQKKPSYEICKKCIQDYLLIADNKLSNDELGVFKKLERALFLAQKISNPELIEKCKKSIIQYEKDVSKDELPGLWGFAYDLLIDGGNKILLTNPEEAEIIGTLEAILKRVCSKDDYNIWSAENVIKRLVKYYNRKNDRSNIRRVLVAMEHAYFQHEADRTAMQTHDWLTGLCAYYEKYNLYEDTERILLKLREIGPDVDKEMKTIPFEFKITKQQMDEIVNPFIRETIEETLKAIIIYYIPRKATIESDILNNKYSLQSLFRNVLYDSRGRMIGILGSVDENLGNHVIHKTAQQISLEAIFLHLIIERAISVHGDLTSAIIGFIKESPIIRPERLNIIAQGLKAHFEGDYLVAIHLLIPQIEEAIRYLVETAGGVVLRANSHGGYNLKTFDELLQSEVIKRILGDDFVNYFRTLFTHPFGWNLRNTVMHGLAESNIFNYQKSERVLHALLCLRLVIRKSQS